MDKDQDYIDLLYQEITKALHDEELLESALPVLYQNATSENYKSIIKKLMDANKRHQDLLDTAALSVVSHGKGAEYENSAIAGFLAAINKLTAAEQAQWGFFVIPTLQKIIHQQVASFQILAALTKHTGYHHLSEDFYGLGNAAMQTGEELQKAWPTTLESTHS